MPDSFFLLKGNEVKIQAIFEGFEKHRLGDDSLNELHTNLRTVLSQVNVDKKDNMF